MLCSCWRHKSYMWFLILCIQYCKYIDLLTDHMKCCLIQLCHIHKQYHILSLCIQHYKYKDQWHLHILNYLNQWYHIHKLKLKTII